MKHQNMFYPRADADLSLYAHPLAADEPRTGLRSVDYNKALPPLRNAIVSITLDNETKTDTIRSMQSAALFKNIPHRFLKNNVRVRIDAQDFLPVDTTLVMTRQMRIGMARNPHIYGDVRFRLWNPDTERSSANTEVTVNGRKVVSDAEGIVLLTIPLAEQKTIYTVRSTAVQLLDSVVYPPFGPDDIVQFK